MKAGIPGFQGKRLREAREALGLTQISLSELIGVSKQAISQYETGTDSPGPEAFDRLRKLLQHDPHFFLRSKGVELTGNTKFYRSLASSTKMARAKSEAWQLWTRELICYVTEFVELPPVNFPSIEIPSDPRMLGNEKIEAIAAEVREAWHLGDGPIPNVVDVAENNGAIVVRHSLENDTLDALSEWLIPEDLPFIVLNAQKNVAVRSRTDLAHELGHLILHRNVPQEMLRHSDMFRLIEDQAFLFGGAFLLPEHSFLEDLYSLSLNGLLSMKSKWKVSVAMMIERLFNLGAISQDQRKKLRIHYSVRHWNREEPYDNEMEVEQPTLLARTIQMMLKEGVRTLDQMSADTGFRIEWINKLLNLPSDLVAPRPQLKLVQFRKRA